MQLVFTVVVFLFLKRTGRRRIKRRAGAKGKNSSCFLFFCHFFLLFSFFNPA